MSTNIGDKVNLVGQLLLFQGVASAMPTRGQAWEFLLLLTKLMDVSIISGPHVYTRDGTVLGFVIIAESHIAIHLYPAPAASYIDVFSCKPFNTEAVVARITSWLNFQRVYWRELDRGVAA